MHKTIALVGKPNTGKSALFNSLTFGKQKTANYPGVTVEKKEGRFKTNHHTFNMIDLPGLYSMIGQNPDEKITINVLTHHQTGVQAIDYILCVIDACQLEFSIRLVLELKQLNIPLIVALNMVDLAQNRGIEIDINTLEETLGVKIFPIVAVKKKSLNVLKDHFDTLSLADAVTPEPQPLNLNAERVRELTKEAHDIAQKAIIKKPKPIELFFDKILLHPLWGSMVLVALLFVVFQAVFSFANYPMDVIDASVGALGEFMANIIPESLLQSLIVDGIIAGVGSVIIFLPQILILFLFILLLEDSGYMARAAFLLDQLMRRVGLPGKAFIPLISSFACAIPGIMSTRTLRHPYDRLTTIMMAPLMTCAARLPVYVLIIAAFVPEEHVFGIFNLQGVVMFGLYIAGILAALLIGWLMSWFRDIKQIEPMLMEMPSYKWPYLFQVIYGVYDRGKAFVQNAGSIIFCLMVFVWFLSTFPGAPANATEPDIYYSFAGMLGRLIEPLLAPIGFDWQMSVALIPGLAAREVVVAVLAGVYALSDTNVDVSHSLIEALRLHWTLPTALSFLAWYVIAPQCLATLGVVKRETNSWRWPLIIFFGYLLFAYIAALITYRLTYFIIGA